MRTGVCSPAWRSSLQAAIQCSQQSCVVASRVASSHQLSSSSSNSLFPRVTLPTVASKLHPTPFTSIASSQRSAVVDLSGAASVAEAEGSEQSQNAAEPSSALKEANGSKVLLCKTQAELEDIAVSLGEKKFRGKQLYEALYTSKKRCINDILQLPKQFRDALLSAGWKTGRSAVHHVATAADGTMKVLLRLEDNRIVETVGIPVEERRGTNRLTACVSSQVGCALRCTFCATGKGGFSRNLKPHEIVEQVLVIEELFKHRVTNVVFMGMGEPLLNLQNVLGAHRVINKHLQIGQRMMTISTVGVPNTISRLSSHQLQSTLAVSLHAPNQELRKQIVPSASGYPLEALMEDCKNYFEATGRRVSFEYTLLAGVNDQPEHANELADLLHRWGLGRHVNLIPYNPIADSDFKRPTRAAIMAFVEALSKRRVTSSTRQTRGLDANAACGQLRNEFQKTPLTAA